MQRHTFSERKTCIAIWDRLRNSKHMQRHTILHEITCVATQKRGPDAVTDFSAEYLVSRQKLHHKGIHPCSDTPFPSRKPVSQLRKGARCSKLCNDTLFSAEYSVSRQESNHKGIHRCSDTPFPGIKPVSRKAGENLASGTGTRKREGTGTRKEQNMPVKEKRIE